MIYWLHISRRINGVPCVPSRCFHTLLQRPMSLVGTLLSETSATDSHFQNCHLKQNASVWQGGPKAFQSRFTFQSLRILSTKNCAISQYFATSDHAFCRSNRMLRASPYTEMVQNFSCIFLEKILNQARLGHMFRPDSVWSCCWYCGWWCWYMLVVLLLLMMMMVMVMVSTVSRRHCMQKRYSHGH